MTSLSVASGRDARRPGRPPVGRRPLALGAMALVALIAFGIAAPRAALHGWLIGFAFAGGVPVGALALLLVHGLTGGRWGEAHRPALVAAALATPALVVLVLPLIVGANLAYPWAADPSRAGAGVAALYLNPLAVGLRSVVGLGILGLFAWRFAREGSRHGRLGMVGAAVGLCVYVAFMNAAAYDWLLSLAPRFTSSAFGTQIIVAQMLSALCFVALASAAEPDDPSWSDIGALMLALTLGESYLILMGLLINWYGDLPDQAQWYMSRTLHGWAWLEVAGAVVGSALPMLALLFAPIRHDPLMLRIVALFILVGLLIQAVWLVAPGTEAASAAAGVAGTAAMAGLLAAASRTLAARGRSRRHVD